MAELLTVARPYAKAAFEYARDNSVLDTWSDALSFLGQVVVNEDIRSFLNSPKLENDQKVSLLVDMLPTQPDDTFVRFLTNLAHQHRLVALKAIAQQFEKLRAEHEQRIDVTVTSAFKLDSKQKTKLTNALKKRLNREISITTQVDQTLIGGVVLRAGDTVIDGSVRGRLDRLSEALTT